MSESPLYVGGMTIDDAIQLHLVDCDQCRQATEMDKPRVLGQTSGHCSQFFHLQMLRADHEGKINNIVAHTENGDEAPRRGRLN